MSENILNFEEDVIQASHSTPVLVDFWAPWCGPCRVLGPVLEQLAREQAGRWTLVKINSDEHPDLSAQFGIRGIPAVKLFHEGKVIDEFTGALPDYAIRQWLDKALPTRAKKDLERAELLFEEGTYAEAKDLLESILEEEPTQPAACALLAQLIVLDNPERAVQLAETAETGDPQTVRAAQAVKTLASFLDIDPDGFVKEEGGDNYVAALTALRNGDPDETLFHLIEVLKVNRYLDDDGPKRLGVALFTVLGDDSEIARRHRRTFDMWLY